MLQELQKGAKEDAQDEAAEGPQAEEKQKLTYCFYTHCEGRVQRNRSTLPSLRCI